MAGLVDYSSSDEEGDDGNKGEEDINKPGQDISHTAPTALPPLPRSFLDLYATNVRTSTADDPSLHQGRTRATPHVAGRWPSHIYIEWFSTSAEHAALGTLLTAVCEALPQPGHSVHSLLVSDLGAPLPLHISLSRPFTLLTAEKTAFLDRLVAAVSSSRVEPFHLSFSGLCWFRSPDSPRAFLVLRVTIADTDDTGETQHDNQPLVTLLARCNDHVAAVGQPTLYARRADDVHGAASAFHVSIAWTLADAIDAWAQPTTAAYDVWQQTPAAALRIHVDSVKTKIGNVVTDMPLAASERRTKRARTNLLGL